MRRAAGPAAALFALLGAGGAAAPSAADRPEAIRIVYTAEVRGNLLPCPCPSRPLGGLGRRIGWIDSLRAASETPLLVVDAGSLLPAGEFFPFLTAEDLARLRCLHAEAADRIGYSAIAGEPAGPEEEGLPWLPPNRSRTVEIGGRSIRLAAVAEHAPLDPERLTGESAPPADLTILLCDGDFHLAGRAAREIGADLAIVSRGAFYSEPIERDGTLFLGPGREGKHVGAVTVSFGAHGDFLIVNPTLRPMDAAVPVPLDWRRRVEETVLWLERRSPGALAPFE